MSASHWVVLNRPRHHYRRLDSTGMLRVCRVSRRVPRPGRMAQVRVRVCVCACVRACACACACMCAAWSGVRLGRMAGCSTVARSAVSTGSIEGALVDVDVREMCKAAHLSNKRDHAHLSVQGSNERDHGTMRVGRGTSPEAHEAQRHVRQRHVARPRRASTHRWALTRDDDVARGLTCHVFMIYIYVILV
jgi:hypothetical protein